MNVTPKNPFDEHPVYETQNYIIRPVETTDADDLFLCYSDPVTLKHMNIDNCGGEFICKTVDVMRHALSLWQKEYENRAFVRLSIRDKKTAHIIGTIEIAPVPFSKPFFGPEKPLGILRLDLLSAYEQETVYQEIIAFMSGELAHDFDVDQVIMKALPEETAKVSVILTDGFMPDTENQFPFDYYYIKSTK